METIFEIGFYILDFLKLKVIFANVTLRNCFVVSYHSNKLFRSKNVVIPVARDNPKARNSKKALEEKKEDIKNGL
ncbi:hypothetical protein L596_017356 [Steinernema carpocapsae]|uniref:Uncharacterized protein n=1 Tax=Steinernema carpocapsae TaxID=34508 RepID=A0A4U5N1S3_STECR|nr:hypothetical protein L596_017356 [Steinernema carpocapsae]